MADIEIRVFGRRFLLVLERQQRAEPAQPDPHDHVAGSFDVAPVPWTDDGTVDMRFGFGRVAPPPLED